MKNNNRIAVKAMSAAWKEPQFKNASGFIDALSNAEEAEFRGVFTAKYNQVDKFYATPELDPDTLAICGMKSGRPYAYASERYEIVQTKDVMTPVALAIEALGVPVEGSIMETADGLSRAVLTVGDPIELADSQYRMMIVAYNSYNKKLAYGGMSGLCRIKCMNGMMDIQGVCEQHHLKHLNGLKDAIKDWTQWLQSASESAMKMGPIIESALMDNLAVYQLEPIYRGLGVKQRAAAEIMDDFDKHFRDVNEIGLNRHSAVNGLTSFFSHRTKSGFATNAAGLELASKLYTADLVKLEDAGNKILKAEAEAKAVKASA